MSAERNRPSDVVLDMLRSARSRQRTARSLVSAGELFGYTGNTMRVTLSRLMARGLLESPERGLYRLTRQTDALNHFVERWREGEARVSAWNGDTWLFAHLQGEAAKNIWALDALGFRPLRATLFGRPANLSLRPAALRTLAQSIGLDADVLLLEGTPEGPTDPWRQLWQPEEMEATYRDSLARLQASAAALPRMPLDEAKLECFRLGGEMIHLLAKDPLLPNVWLNAEPRRQLWQAMLAYDAQGKDIWAAGKADALNHMPRPQLLQETA